MSAQPADRGVPNDRRSNDRGPTRANGSSAAANGRPSWDTLTVKALPHNFEAERATLGAILLDREAIIPLASWLTAKHFYVEAHAWIYEAQLACYHRRVPPDLQTITEELRRAERLDLVGGLPFLIELTNCVPTAYHVEYYAKIVERTAVLRNLIQVGAKITALGYDEIDDVEQTLDAAEQALFEVSQRRGLQDFVPLSKIVDAYYDYLHQIDERGPELLGTPTGFVDFDKMTGGLQRSDLLILAARPGVGKSSLAMSMAFNIATQQGKSVGVFSLEMGREQLLQRLLATHTGIDSQKLRTGRLSIAELQALTDALNYMSGVPIYIDDTAGISISELRAKARRLQAEHGLELLIVDYLQLVNGSGGKNDNRVQEVSEISRGLKALARELNIPVLALSQLSRAVEGRASHVPVLADLRESGAIEADADMVIFIYREELYDKDTDHKGVAELHIAKHRNGPLGQVSLFFDQRTTRFRNMTVYQSPEGY